MSSRRVHRHRDLDDLSSAVARRLLDELVALQARQSLAQVCVCGGETALSVYRALAELVPGSDLDPTRLELWWADESYTATSEADRSAGKVLGVLARAFHLDPARTHPMPARLESVDVDNAALQYATELGSTKFDICLLAVGLYGQVAAIFPEDITKTSTVFGVHDAPVPPDERISVSLPTINASREVWVLAAGAAKADIVAAAMAPDATLPASLVRGTRATRWFIDAAAGAKLPRHACAW